MQSKDLSPQDKDQLHQLDDMFYSTKEISYVDYMASRNRILGDFTTKIELGYAFDALMQGEISREDFDILSLSQELPAVTTETE